MVLKYSVIGIFNIFLYVTAQHETWNYTDQESWPGFCIIGGTQSPVNIPVFWSNRVSDIPALQFQRWEEAVESTVTNNGHTVSVQIPGDTKPMLSGGGLNGTYLFENLHFHWPAEHSIGLHRFDLEGHVIFYSSSFPNFTEATKVENGVAVIAIFYNTIETDGPTIFDELAFAAERVSKEVDLQTLTDPIIFNDLLPSNQRPFYHYKGSLTTPNCNEVVNWYILRDAEKINSKQFKTLTTIYGSNYQLLHFNNRKIHPLNGRSVDYSTEEIFYS